MVTKFIKFHFDDNDNAICDDAEGTCDRKICECDKQLVHSFDTVTDVHNEEYWAFGGFNFEEQCEALLTPIAADHNAELLAQCCEMDNGERVPFMSGSQPNHKTCCNKTGLTQILTNRACDEL